MLPPSPRDPLSDSSEVVFSLLGLVIGGGVGVYIFHRLPLWCFAVYLAAFAAFIVFDVKSMDRWVNRSGYPISDPTRSYGAVPRTAYNQTDQTESSSRLAERKAAYVMARQSMRYTSLHSIGWFFMFLGGITLVQCLLAQTGIHGLDWLYVGTGVVGYFLVAYAEKNDPS